MARSCPAFAQGVQTGGGVQLRTHTVQADCRCREEGLCTGIDIDATPAQIADAIDNTMGTVPPSIQIPTWDDCVDILEVAYKEASEDK